jgi:uncharacterized protein (DUF433 family)
MFDWSRCPVVGRNPERCGGVLTLRGTRTPLATFFSCLKDNMSVAEFLWEYPGYDRDQIEALLDFLEKSCAEPPRVSFPKTTDAEHCMQTDIKHAHANEWTTSRYAQAYTEMAEKTHFRPAAPSDVFGTISLSQEEVSDPDILAQEARCYAENLAQQEEDGMLTIQGCTNGDTNKLFVFLFNAAQLCCGGCDALPYIKRLIHVAYDEAERIDKERDARGASAPAT